MKNILPFPKHSYSIHDAVELVMACWRLGDGDPSYIDFRCGNYFFSVVLGNFEKRFPAWCWNFMNVATRHGHKILLDIDEFMRIAEMDYLIEFDGSTFTKGTVLLSEETARSIVVNGGLSSETARSIGSEMRCFMSEIVRNSFC